MNKIIVSQSLIYDTKTKVYKDQLDNQVISYLYKLNYIPITISNGFKNPIDFLKKLKISGIIITGGANIGIYPKRDKLETKLIDYSLTKKIPLLGICRGMQLINHYFKGNLNKINNHVRTKHYIKTKNSKRKYLVNSYHNFSINEKRMNTNLTPIHRHTKDSTIESFVHSKYKLLGIMWHPERQKKIKSFDKTIIQNFFKHK